jgi:MoaA/NifB/PqqE/SkfB family radical SAM enzyme
MRSIEFDELMDRVAEHAGAAPELVRVMLELTYGCNLRCVHCYNPTHEARNELSTEQVCMLLDQLAAQGCLWLGLTGGELFTRRDALDILRHAKALGMVVNLLTNATMVTPALADRLVELDPYLIEVSVYGATAKTYEEVTGIPGSFARFVEGVDVLLARGLQLLLKLVLMTLNVHEHEAMQQFALTRVVRYQASTEIHPRADGVPTPLTYRLPPERAFEVWQKESGDKLQARHQSNGCSEASALTDSHGESGSGKPLFDCRCGKTSAAITPHGLLNLCLSVAHPNYDLRTGPLAAGWRRRTDIVASAKPGTRYECSPCAISQHCTRGTMDSWLEHGVFDAECNPYYRALAEHKVQFIAPDSLRPRRIPDVR